MRLAFLGTPDFALPMLDRLLEIGHEIVRVYSQPPRPAGRGQQFRPSAVVARAQAAGLTVETPRSFKDDALQARFAALALDAAVVVAYGLLLPGPVLAAPRLGCINLHASLLPRWRGAAPMQRAIMAGDRETGATAMLMDAGLDTGPILLQQPIALGAQATFGWLHDRMAQVGTELVVRALDGLAAGTLRPRPQPTAGACYARKLEPVEYAIDWRRPAVELDRQIRALSPRPGAWFEHRGERLRALLAEPLSAPVGEPGQLMDDRLTVACGAGALRLLRLQRAGKAPLDAAAFLRGYRLGTGERLG
ncbi:MAG: methionyl-tRNA formyltransferase [Alphaproteobacteria bacterium]|nr:methionyl-tRNA formyltransferase [Alphaproteobacteria bacterium]